jgi:predicted SnoaL-like aldol condensation-catalyzing enzyme
MSTEENKTTLRRWIDAMNKRDLNVLDKLADELFTADYISHNPGLTGFERGPEGVKKFIHQALKDMADIHVIIEDQIADGDKVVSRITYRFTDKTTSKPVNILGIVIDRFVGEKLAEEWELDLPGQW